MLARQYYDGLKAPRKQFFSFSNTAHSPLYEHPATFHRLLSLKIFFWDLGQVSSIQKVLFLLVAGGLTLLIAWVNKRWGTATTTTTTDIEENSAAPDASHAPVSVSGEESPAEERGR